MCLEPVPAVKQHQYIGISRIIHDGFCCFIYVIYDSPVQLRIKLFLRGVQLRKDAIKNATNN